MNGFKAGYDLLRSAHERRDIVYGGHRAHPFGVGLPVFAMMISTPWLFFFGALPSLFTQIGLAHRNPFSADAHGENIAPRFDFSWGRGALLFVKFIELTSRLALNLFNLPLGNFHPVCLWVEVRTSSKDNRADASAI